MCTLASYGKDSGLKTSRIAADEVRSRRYQQGATTVQDIASESDLPVKFLALILLELKHARIVESARGSAGGWRLRRDPSEIRLSEIIRMMDGPLAPFGDADRLRNLIAQDAHHRKLYRVFLDVRDAAAAILENTTIADLVRTGHALRFKIRNRRPTTKRSLKSG
jgi:Rrf2 family protein